MSAPAAVRPPRARLYPGRAGGMALVLLSGVLWSVQGFLLHLMISASGDQVVFWRNSGQSVLLWAVLWARTRGRVGSALRRAGRVAVLGGLCQLTSSVCVVLAFLHTTVANVVFIMASSPFVAALLAWVVMRERLAAGTWIAMTAALAGIGVMVSGGLEGGHLLGNLLALATTAGFASLAVVVRYGHMGDMLPAVCWGGVFGALAGLALAGGHVAVPPRDAALAFLMGAALVAGGLMLFVEGARHMPAGLLAFLTLTEIVLAPVWAWLGLGEVPSGATLAGGVIVLAAIAAQAILRPEG